jgi:hypothetical protein
VKLVTLVPDRITLQYSTTPQWQSHIIRVMCHSPFSHVDCVLADGSLLGASDGGVKIRAPDYEVFSLRQRLTIATRKADAILARLNTQLGKPFDGSALHAFLAVDHARNWRDNGAWFCSELVMWAFEIEGFFNYKLPASINRITPADSLLVFNPYFDVAAFEASSIA